MRKIKNYFRLMLHNDCEISDKEYCANREKFVWEGVLATIITNITTGAFLTGYAKYMGANDQLCGILLSTNSFAALFQIFGPRIYEKFQHRKAFVAVTALIGRFLLGLMVFIPVLVSGQSLKIGILFSVYIFSYTLIHFHAPAAVHWIMSLVPDSMRGKYFGRRDSVMLAVVTIVNLAFGIMLDLFKKNSNDYVGYVIIFSFVGVLAIADFLLLFNIREPKVKVRTVREVDSGKHVPAGLNLKQMIIVPLLHEEFRKVIKLLFFWTISTACAIPYFSIYQVAVLKLSYTFIMVCGMITSGTMVLASRIWGRIADRYGWIFVLKVNMCLIAAGHFTWFFVTGRNAYFIVPLLSLWGGIAWAGINMSIFNIPYLYAPQKAKTVYIGFSAALAGMVSLVTSLLAALFIKVMSGKVFHLLGMQVINMQFLFVLSSILILLVFWYVSKTFSKRKPEMNNIKI